jgi:hypothetical protein
MMKRLRFLHIPKTAGSAFESILGRKYPKGKFSFTGNIPADIDRFKSLSEQAKQDIQFFCGHAPVTTGLKEADEAAIITFLRDPIARVCSYCQHVSEGKSPSSIQRFPPESFDLEAFLHSGSAQLSNLQTKMLINEGDAISSSLMDRLSPSDAKEMALENLLNKISGFGLQEYFDESLLLFCQLFDWSTPWYIARNTKNPAKLLEFKQHHLDYIAELNSIDMEVYKSAKERFITILQEQNYGGLIKTLYFQSSQSLEYSEPIVLNTAFAKDLDDRTQMLLGFESETPSCPTTLRSSTAWPDEVIDRLLEDALYIKYLEAKLAKAREKVKAMESSNFWKARLLWVSMKKKLGLITTKEKA